MDALPLAGRTALVTGAAAGIGAAISRELAGFGATVVLADLDADAAGKLAAELPAARALEVDLDDAAAVERCADAAESVDILVSNAGITVVERFSDSDPAGWDRMWRDQPAGAAATRPPAAARDDAAGLRPGGIHLLRQRPGRRGRGGHLLRDQGGPARSRQVSGPGSRAGRGDLQRGVSRPHRHQHAARRGTG